MSSLLLEWKRAEFEGGWQGASESAVSAQTGFGVMFGAKPPSEAPSKPRPSSVHLEEDAVRKTRSSPITGCLQDRDGVPA